MQASNGVGKHLNTLSSTQLTTDQKVIRHIFGRPFNSAKRFLQAQYAADLLYVPSLCLSKLAVTGLIHAITPLKKDKRMVYGLAATILSWALIGEFGSAFQCHSAETWKYIEGRCFNRVSRYLGFKYFSKPNVQTAWWNYLEITNMLTDAALIILPTIILWKIQTSISKKIPIISSFAIRIT